MTALELLAQQLKQEREDHEMEREERKSLQADLNRCRSHR